MLVTLSHFDHSDSYYHEMTKIFNTVLVANFYREYGMYICTYVRMYVYMYVAYVCC